MYYIITYYFYCFFTHQNLAAVLGFVSWDLNWDSQTNSFLIFLKRICYILQLKLFEAFVNLISFLDVKWNLKHVFWISSASSCNWFLNFVQIFSFVSFWCYSFKILPTCHCCLHHVKVLTVIIVHRDCLLLSHNFCQQSCFPWLMLYLLYMSVYFIHVIFCRKRIHLSALSLDHNFL